MTAADRPPTGDPDHILTTLQRGEINMLGEFVWGSNYTFLAHITYQDTTLRAVYKPVRGERPLWDFPPQTLAHREAAAYLISQALGWQLVPPTIYRKSAPLGSGSLQYFIEHNADYHYFTFSQSERQRLRPAALFDILINNADRKGSHILLDSEKHLWLIDHGICFHQDHKLRTVIWDFAGESIPENLLESLRALKDDLLPPRSSAPESERPRTALASALAAHLSPEEIAALLARAERLLARPFFPNPHPDHRAIPWPPV